MNNKIWQAYSESMSNLRTINAKTIFSAPLKVFVTLVTIAFSILAKAGLAAENNNIETKSKFEKAFLSKPIETKKTKINCQQFLADTKKISQEILVRTETIAKLNQQISNNKKGLENLGQLCQTPNSPNCNRMMLNMISQQTPLLMGQRDQELAQRTVLVSKKADSDENFKSCRELTQLRSPSQNESNR